MRKILALSAVVMMSGPALAATPGVDDVVSCVRAGDAHPNAITFQTVNGGGDTTGSGACIAGVTFYCVGIGTSSSPTLGQTGNVVLNGLSASRLAGKFVNFVDKGSSYYPDCPSTTHGVGPFDF